MFIAVDKANVQPVEFEFQVVFCLRYEFQVSFYYDSAKLYKILRMREI